MDTGKAFEMEEIVPGNRAKAVVAGAVIALVAAFAGVAVFSYNKGIQDARTAPQTPAPALTP